MVQQTPSAYYSPPVSIPAGSWGPGTGGTTPPASSGGTGGGTGGGGTSTPATPSGVPSGYVPVYNPTERSYTWMAPSSVPSGYVAGTTTSGAGAGQTAYYDPSTAPAGIISPEQYKPFQEPTLTPAIIDITSLELKPKNLTAEKPSEIKYELPSEAKAQLSQLSEYGQQTYTKVPSTAWISPEGEEFKKDIERTKALQQEISQKIGMPVFIVAPSKEIFPLSPAPTKAQLQELKSHQEAAVGESEKAYKLRASSFGYAAGAGAASILLLPITFIKQPVETLESFIPTPKKIRQLRTSFALEPYSTSGYIAGQSAATAGAGFFVGKGIGLLKGKTIIPKIETAADITYRETLASEGKVIAIEQTATEGRIYYELKGKPIKELSFRSGTIAETGIIKAESGSALKIKGTQITQIETPKGMEMLKTEFGGGGKVIEIKEVPTFDISLIGKTEVGKMPPTEWKTIINKGKLAGAIEVPKFSDFKPVGKSIETAGIAKGKMQFEIKAEGEPTIQQWKFAETTYPLKETKIQPKATVGISTGAIGKTKEITLIGGKEAAITKELWLGKREMTQGDIGLSYKEAFKAAYEKEAYKPEPFIPPKPMKSEYPFKWMAEKSVTRQEAIFEPPKQIKTPSLLQASKIFREEAIKQMAEKLLPEIKQEFVEKAAQKGKQIGDVMAFTTPKEKQEFKFEPISKQKTKFISEFKPTIKTEILPAGIKEMPPIIIPVIKPITEQPPQQRQQPFQLIIPETTPQIPQVLTPTPPIITPRPLIPPRTPPPLTPFGWLPSVEGAEQEQRKPYKAGQQKTRYAPSLAGVYMGATIKKAPKLIKIKGIKTKQPKAFTGFEIRPVVLKKSGKSLMSIFGRM